MPVSFTDLHSNGIIFNPDENKNLVVSKASSYPTLEFVYEGGRVVYLGEIYDIPRGRGKAFPSSTTFVFLTRESLVYRALEVSIQAPNPLDTVPIAEIISDENDILEIKNFNTPYSKVIIGDIERVVYTRPSGGGGVGDITDGKNIGIGEGVFAGKNGQFLQFRSLLAGAGIGISLSPSGNEIEVSNTAQVMKIIGVTTVPNTVTLFTSDLQAKRLVTVNDESGQASSISPITIQGQGGELIDNSSSYQITSAYGQARFYSDGVKWWSW